MKNKAIRLTAKMYLSKLIEENPFYSGEAFIDELIQKELERITTFKSSTEELDPHSEAEMVLRAIEITSSVTLPRNKAKGLFD